MKGYLAEPKESVIRKMMPPHNVPISRLAEEPGISDVTLYNWRKQARVEGIAVPADGKNPEKWSSDTLPLQTFGAMPLSYCYLCELGYCNGMT